MVDMFLLHTQGIKNGSKNIIEKNTKKRAKEIAIERHKYLVGFYYEWNGVK